MDHCAVQEYNFLRGSPLCIYYSMGLGQRWITPDVKLSREDFEKKQELWQVWRGVCPYGCFLRYIDLKKKKYLW